MTRYVVAGVVALVLVAAAAAYFRPSIPGFIPRVTETKDAEVMADVEAKDAAIRSLSSEIGRLRQESDKAREKAIAAIAVADSWQARSSELARKVGELERAARERPKITTGAQADATLRELGYGELLQALGR